MLIGIDASRALRVQRTGTERYARAIIQHLIALPEAVNHHWRLYGDVEPDSAWLAAIKRSASDRHAPDRAVEFCLLPAQRIWTHRALARAVQQTPPDVLFIPAHVLPFTLPARRLPPSVVTVHDLGYHHVPEAHTWLQRCYLWLSTRWAALSATKLLAISQATAKDLQHYYHVAPQKIRVVYEGTTVLPVATSAAQRQVGQRQVAQQYQLTRPYALYVGTIQPRKNLARLIRAYAKLIAANDIAWDLVLAGGRGWLSDALYALVRELKLDTRVNFLGYVPDDALAALMGGAQFFAFPSLFEGFGLPVLEAQSIGVPVMTANNSSLPEVAGDAALLVDPTDIDAIADAMLRLSQDEALRQRLIEAGYENIKRFSWEKAARETLAVLEEAADKG